jgi:acyl-coenzyme A thioesterase PaaI-like protein
VGSVAVSGIANGGITLAQADTAVAMSQSERASGPNRQSLDN